MKYFLIALAVVALSVSAFAQDGDNTTAKMFVHVTDGASPVLPTNNLTVVNEYSPAAFTTVRAYIGLTDLSTGFISVVFKLNNVLTQYPGIVGTQSFTNLLPGNLAIGDPFGTPGDPGGTGDGVTLAVACQTGSFHLVGYVEYFYLGGEFSVEIIPHGNPAWDHWVVDCNEPGRVNAWCLWLNGGVGGMTAPAGDTECSANTPAEDATWGAIKALYR